MRQDITKNIEKFLLKGFLEFLPKGTVDSITGSFKRIFLCFKKCHVILAVYFNMNVSSALCFPKLFARLLLTDKSLHHWQPGHTRAKDAGQKAGCS